MRRARPGRRSRVFFRRAAPRRVGMARRAGGG
eukprot:CAMPEP_0179367640 /NCGR_PEP_ID=MMETSP0797-20121207/83678_1 /TAXON_ID=47934 /ORGANISM="Dinophysis acuminata, Strain DAEP01" /LENGTH=31 /DNA_ID= /DNA_START= /DNA_END= /DNA_ORIENTATION=